MFLNEHKNLSRLHLMIYEMKDSLFLNLTVNSTDIVEVSAELLNRFRETGGISSDDIVEFLQSHEKLKQIKLINIAEDVKIDLQQHIIGH